MAHPWHDVELPADLEPGEFPVVIEVPAGDKNKYEVDKETGLLRVDRVLFSSVHYPHNYGFVPRTLAEDGDALDVLVLGQEAVAPLSILQARAIGGFRMRDEAGPDEKIVCVHVNDPAFCDYRRMEELPRHVVAETMEFFERYKALEDKDSEVGERLDREEAVATVERAADRYREVWGGRASPD